jgi:hypothetical protein
MFGRVEVEHPAALKRPHFAKLFPGAASDRGVRSSAVGHLDETRVSFSTAATSS